MEEYSLVWNEFTDFTTETFKDLLTDKYFTDVTLVCDDDKQVGAHKVILSACSPFFRKILVNNPHPNPLIYLQGIRYQDLDTIIKFMYLGQAQLPEKDLKRFLVASKALQIKGLNNQREDCQEDGEEEEDAHCYIPNIQIKTEVLDNIRDNSVEAAGSPTFYPEIDDDQKTAVDMSETEDSFSGTIKIEKIESYDVSQGATKKKVFYCDKCDYKASYSVSVKYHHQTVHEGLRFDCDQCDAFFTRKESLKTHIRSIHEGIRYPCDLCEYKATESGALKKT